MSLRFRNDYIRKTRPSAFREQVDQNAAKQQEYWRSQTNLAWQHCFPQDQWAHPGKDYASFNTLDKAYLKEQINGTMNCFRAGLYDTFGGWPTWFTDMNHIISSYNRTCQLELVDNQEKYNAQAWEQKKNDLINGLIHAIYSVFGTQPFRPVGSGGVKGLYPTA